MSKGTAREQGLARRVDDDGWSVIRSPSSGSVDRPQPDLAISRRNGPGGDVDGYALEVKASAGDPVYLDEREVDELRQFAFGFDLSPLIGVRFNYCEWAFFDPAELYRTESGNYRVKKLDLDDGLSYGEVFG